MAAVATKKRTGRKRVGRKPLREKRKNCHVHLKLTLYRETKKKADDLDITFRDACERGLELFLKSRAS